ncbi:ABC transporter substrate-binding protein [Corynebacterium provencense]|uniref:ABC transporter substrate-binding protein n=1 Tax=Corynebacterium provencense TaxID=1737425 RepID=UPI00098FE5D4|nr:ABC transporter substrate-binding protein [Corynebacterium provencense]
MKRSLRRITAAIVGTVAVAAMAACGSNDDSTSSPNTDNGAYPLTVKTATTETTLTSKPSRIAALGTVSLENLVALDTEPVYAKVDGTRDSQPYIDNYWEKAYVDSSRDKDSNFEKVAATNPDLIIAPSWSTYQDKETIKKLETIAPTIVYDVQSAGSRWTDGFSQVAKALNRSDKASSLIDNYNHTVEEQKKTLSALHGERYITGGLTDDGSFQLTTAMSVDLRELGLLPGSPQDEIERQKSEGNSTETKLSAELFGKIDADFVLDYGTRDDSAIESRKQNDAYRDHILEKAYWMYDNEGNYLATAFNNSGALGKPWMMERVDEMFDQPVQL